MRVFDWLRRPIRYCFRTRRRAQLTVLLLAALGWLAWYGTETVRASVAVSDARKALTRYDFAKARERLQSASHLRPRRPAIWLLGAQVARREGEYAEAKMLLNRYEALAGTSTREGRLEAALQRVQEGEIEGDVDFLLPLVDADDPAAEQILEALAVGAVHVYHIDRAGFWLHHLLTRFPKNPIGRLLRAQMDDTLGKHDRAAALCRELLADFPDNWKARQLHAGLLYRAQQFAEAADEYEELRRRRPDDLGPLLGLARCRDRLGRDDEARALMREMEERFPDSSQAMLECGRFAVKEGRAADAERLLRRAAQLAPNDHEVHYQLGLCLEQAGKTDEARAHFDRFKQIEAELVRMNELLKAVVTAPRDPAPRREAGLICLRNGQTAEGLRWLHGAIEVAPTDRASHEALANFYQGQGDLQRANLHRQRAR